MSQEELRVNDRIRISPIRLIDDEGEQVGIVPTDEARRMARERGLDLVEVAPNARPPVCKLMDYGKHKSSCGPGSRPTTWSSRCGMRGDSSKKATRSSSR